MKKSVLGTTGADIEIMAAKTNDSGFHLESFASDLGVNGGIAARIADQTRTAQVVLKEDGSVTMFTEGDRPKKPPQKVSSIFEKSIVEKWFPPDTSIVVHAEMSESFRESMGSIMPSDVVDKKGLELALRIGGIYEIGRFAGKQAFQSIKAYFKDANQIIPSSRQEATGFYERIAEEMLARELPGVGTEINLTREAIDTYDDVVRRERFCARAGLMAVKIVYPPLDGDLLISRFGSNLFSDYIGDALQTTTDGDEDRLDKSVYGAVPPFAEIGATFPLSGEEFAKLIDWVNMEENVTDTAQRFGRRSTDKA